MHVYDVCICVCILNEMYIWHVCCVRDVCVCVMYVCMYVCNRFVDWQILPNDDEVVELFDMRTDHTYLFLFRFLNVT
jgi:hypothetical protein